MSVINMEESPLFMTKDYNYVKRMIGEDEELKNVQQVKGSFALFIIDYLSDSGMEDVIEIVNAVLSALITLTYAIETYYDTGKEPRVLQIIELIILTVFILQYLLFFYIAESRLAYCFNIYSILDYITIIPFFLVRIGTLEATRFLLFWRVFRLFSIFRIDKLFKKNKEINRRTFTLIFTLVATLWFISSAMYEVENTFLEDEIPKVRQKIANGEPLTGFQGSYPDEKYKFHEMIYFMIVTMTTVGYGDIFPFTDLGRFLIIMTILVMLGLLPTQFQAFIKAQSLTSRYAQISYKKPKRDSKHIVILGNAPPDDIKTFLDECYHLDHGQTDISVIIMRNSTPTKELVDILKPHVGRALFLEGNPLSHHDLKRAQADTATCVVVLSNKFCKDPIVEDYNNILQSFGIKQYAKAKRDRELRLCLQLVKPEHKDLYYSGLQSEIRIDQVICVEELKLQLLAKSCISPGIITIIWSLITSNTPSIDLKGKKQKVSKKEKLFPDINKGDEDEWMKNYLLGMDFELYRVPLKQKDYAGFKFKDVVMILFHQLHLILVALEVKIGDQLKVFVNPSEYVFEPIDHHGYVINHDNPAFNDINNLNLDKNNNENFFIHRYLNRKEMNSAKRSQFLCNMNISKSIGAEVQNQRVINYDNFACTKKPVPLIEAQINHCSEKRIENHIIVCGIVSGIRNLILPLRSKTLSNPRIPIVILSNDNGREDSIDCETYIWREINRFEEIYIMQGSALNPADLEKARITKAKAVIILSKPNDYNANIKSQNMMDADVIFMYKTIKSTFSNSIIITELASTSTINFLIQGKDENLEKYGYSISRPFAAGEIYFSSLLDTLLCQAYYAPKITEILDQLIMGSANTSEKFSKLYKQFNLSQCSLTSVPVPDIRKLSFENLFEYFVKVHNMIPIGVYKRSSDDPNFKPYVWLYPKEEKENKITTNDELFVLSDKIPQTNVREKSTNQHTNDSSSHLQSLKKLNAQLQDLFSTTKEVSQDVKSTNNFLNEDLSDKVKSDLYDEIVKHN